MGINLEAKLNKGVMMRLAGVLLPVSMLNGRHGIGDFGKEAYQFIDIIADMGFKLWQILPLNPVGYANSPYQPQSSYAGDEIYIDLDELYHQGLLTHKPRAIKAEHRIDYDAVRKNKEKYLHKAFANFKADKNYAKFAQQEVIYNYAVYVAFRKAEKGKNWTEWPKPLKNWINDKELDLKEYQEEINYQLFVQYIFYQQWLKLKNYANSKGIKIVGDIPIYVGHDSADVWQDQKNFLLNRYGRPNFVAGVPPDYFNKNGQRWGNPLYDWDHIVEQDFAYWLKRISYNAKLYDVIRIDHFRAFDTFWKIKARNKTARKGEWIEAPGMELFAKIEKELPKVEIIAEDLGDLRPEVGMLRDAYGLMGMNIMQFTFNPDDKGKKYNLKKEVVLYTGTHDNQTIKGYFESQTQKRQKAIKKLLAKCGAKSPLAEVAYLEVMFANIADYAIVPVQDILGLGDESQINRPGSIHPDNWTYKLTSLQPLQAKTEFMKTMLTQTKRI